MATLAAPLLPGLVPLRSAYACLRARPLLAQQQRRSISIRRIDVGRRTLAAIVVGAGPAGVATVGSLLDHLPAASTVGWYDADFAGGRINHRYREVPGNTRTRLFVDYARSSKALSDIVDSTPAPNAVTVLEGLPGDDTCSLAYAGDTLSMLITGLQGHRAVDAQPGRVVSAQWDPSTRLWTVTRRWQHTDPATDTPTRRQDKTQAPLLVLCTGASPSLARLPAGRDLVFHPRTTKGHTRRLDLDTALKPSLLAETLPAGPLTVGVVGASHSAILVLMNLYTLATTSPAHKQLKVRWFSRVPPTGSLRYAEYKPEGWILWDNTGLKGRAAQFARDNLDNPTVLANSPVSTVIQRIDCSGGPEHEGRAFRDHLLGRGTSNNSSPCDFVVQAIGYTQDPLPETFRTVIDKANTPPTPLTPIFDNITGTFTAKETGEPIPSLHGAGIAFPERVTDPEGNVEHAVGFYKFVKFLNRVMPQWVSAAKEANPTAFFKERPTIDQ